MKNKPRGDVVAQLNALKSWSQNPEAYFKKQKLEKKQIKVVKKPLPKDWQPKYLNGNVIDITPLINDPYWLIKPEKPEDEDTSIQTPEGIIRAFVQTPRTDKGVASLMRLKKFVG